MRPPRNKYGWPISYFWTQIIAWLLIGVGLACGITYIFWGIH